MTATDKYMNLKESSLLSVGITDKQLLINDEVNCI